MKTLYSIAISTLVCICLVSGYAVAEEVGSFRFIMPVSSSGSASTMGTTNVNATVNESISTGFFSTQTVSLNVSGAFKEELIDSPTSTAFSLHYISPWGIGAGYTSQKITYKLGLEASGPVSVSGTINSVGTSYTLADGYVIAEETIDLDLGYLDIFYCHRFFETFSVTGGFGLPVFKADGSVSVSGGTNSAVSTALDAIVQASLASSKMENASAYTLYFMLGYLISDFEVLAGYRQTNLKADFKLNSTIADFLDKDTINWNVQLTEYQLGLAYRF